MDPDRAAPGLRGPDFRWGGTPRHQQEGGIPHLGAVRRLPGRKRDLWGPRYPTRARRG